MKLKNFKPNTAMLLFVILIIAFVLRILFLSTPETVWWDEAEYLATAKHWALGTPYEVGAQRQPLLPMLMTIFYFIGITSLPFLKFFTVAIPSTLAVWATYLLGKEMYNKKIGLISSFVMAVCWVPVFWTSRFSTDLLGLTLGLFGFLFTYKYTKDKKLSFILLAALFLGLGLLTRVGNILPIAIVALYLLITQPIKTLKDKNIYYAIGLGLLIIIPYLIWNIFYHGKIFAFWTGYFGTETAVEKLAKPIAWNLLSFFKTYPDWVFLIFLVIGAVTLINLIIGFDLVYKKTNRELKADLFSVIMILIPMIFFIFIERNAEPRWAIIMSAALFFLVAKGLLLVYDFIKKYNKQIAIVFLFVVLIVGAIPHITTAKNLIEIRSTTFAGLADSGVWLKENSDPDDIIFSSATPQHSYYAERLVKGYPPTEELFQEKIDDIKPRYMVISQYERSPEYAYEYPNKYPDKVKLVSGLFSDPEQTQPILLIYEFVY